MGEGGMSPGEMRMHDMMMRRMMRGGEMGGGMGAAAGARFMLRAGDVRLAVQCSPGEPMKACVDAATSLMDRAKTMAPTPAPGRAPARASGSGSTRLPDAGRDDGIGAQALTGRCASPAEARCRAPGTSWPSRRVDPSTG